MKRIEVKRNCVNSRVPITEQVNVELSTTYQGHEIWRCTQKWYYVLDNSSNWQYFGTLGEAKRFINNTYWGD